VKDTVSSSHAIKIHRGIRGTGPLIFTLGIRRWIWLSLSPLLHPGRNKVSIEHGVGWVPKPGCAFWRRHKSLTPTRIRTPDRPARSIVAIPTKQRRLLKTPCKTINLTLIQLQQYSSSCALNGLLTYSTVQSPFWEANWFAASEEIPRISRNPKVHYRTHKRPSPVSILGQPNPVHTPTSHLLEIHPNIIHPSTPRSPQWSLTLRFPHQVPRALNG